MRIINRFNWTMIAVEIFRWTLTGLVFGAILTWIGVMFALSTGVQ